jgi:antitoxin ParD1/3/4
MLHGIVMKITLEAEQQAFVQSQLASGTYVNTDDLINRAIALLADRHQKLTDLKAKIEVGTTQIHNGQVIEGELAFQQLEAKYPYLAELDQ